jgi:hypothetical protein
MPLVEAALNAMATELISLATHVAVHEGDPGTTGANPADSARQAADWSAPANGDFDLDSELAFTGGGASSPATHIGLWSSAGTGTPPTGGTFYGGAPLTGDQEFNAAGEYTVTNVTVNGSSS